MGAIDLVSGTIYEAKDAFVSVLSDRALSFEREAGFAVQALTANDYALRIAMQNRQSVINAITNIAAIGISLNPAKKQAYLVPRDNRICLDISYIGLMDLAMATGAIRWAQAELVYENDAFALNGFDKPPTHTYDPFSKDRGDVVGVYVVVKTADGDYLTETMSIDEVNAIRDRSSAWHAWLTRKARSPWVTDPGEMAKKTCVKRAYKYWPKTERLEQAIHHLNTDGNEGLHDIAVQIDQPERVDVLPMITEALATTTDEEALAYWKANNGRLARQPQDHARLKQEIMRHRQALRAQAEQYEAEAMIEYDQIPYSDDEEA